MTRVDENVLNILHEVKTYQRKMYFAEYLAKNIKQMMFYILN